MGLALDVSSEQSFAELASHVAAQFGPIRIWVNNAGIYPGSSFLEMTSSDWDEVFDHNLKSRFSVPARLPARWSTPGTAA